MKTKKLISLLLVVCMLCSMGTAVFATTDYRNGTDVTYNPADPDGIPDSGDEVDLESYTITVPAKLLPGTEGPVTLEGRWASNRVVTVTAEPSVEMVNSINANDTKTLTVTFAGISEKGDNEKSQKFVENVKVAEITNALFGTWSGHFEYQVGIGNVTIEGGNDVEKSETPIPVTATDKNGNDLNADSYEIIGEDKEDLLNKLKDANVILPELEVDMLIEVESDDFDGLAETTFDVSNIAQPGDKVVILHYNEETQEWEFISEEVVNEDGKVTADFSSYSPVAFVVIKADGTREIIISKSPVLFGKYYAVDGDTDAGNGMSQWDKGYVFYEDGSCICYRHDGSVDYYPAGMMTYCGNKGYAYNLKDEYGNPIPYMAVSADGKVVSFLLFGGKDFIMVDADPVIYNETYRYCGNDEGTLVYLDVVLYENSTMDLIYSDGTVDSGSFVHCGNKIMIGEVEFYIYDNGAVLAGPDGMVFALANKQVVLHYESEYAWTQDAGDQTINMKMIPHANNTADVYMDGEFVFTMEFYSVGNVLYNQDGQGIWVSDDGNTLTVFDYDGLPMVVINKA